MRVFGLDPGATTGWCVYDSIDRRAVDAGEFRGHDMPMTAISALRTCELVAVEAFTQVAAGIYPATVQAAYTCGRLVERLEGVLLAPAVVELSRLAVKKALTAAVHGEVHVKNDATAWAALKLMHGANSDAKPRTRKGVVVAPGGPLGIVKGHGRAALAVAVAATLRREPEGEAAPGPSGR